MRVHQLFTRETQLYMHTHVMGMTSLIPLVAKKLPGPGQVTYVRSHLSIFLL